MAHELHDSATQILSALSIKIGSLSKKLEQKDVKTGLVEVQTGLKATIGEIREAILSLRGEKTLSSIEELITRFNKEYDTEVQFQIKGYRGCDISPLIEHQITLVVQEALMNAWKHSQASTIWIEVEITGQSISATVQDNGRGFTQEMLEEARKNYHVGLKQMKERIHQLGGQFTIKSCPGEGTTIQATFGK